MIKHLNKKFLLLTFVFLSWVTMWVSINAIPYEIEYMTDSIVNFINGSRSIAAILFSVSSLVLLFFLIILKKIKKLSIILSLFALYFIFQFIGLAINETRVIDMTSSYLILYALSTISVLIIIDSQKLHKILPYFFYFALSILTVAYLIILTQSSDSFTILFRGNFYRLLPDDEMIFNQVVPKVTGLTRSFGIISLSLLVILAYKNKANLLSLIIFSIIIFSIIIFLSIVIWLAQSRGTILCYYITSIFFIIFLNNLDQFKKFLLIISITFFSIVASNTIINIAKSNLLEIKDSIEAKKLNESISKNENMLPRIFEIEAGTSGRISLWKKALVRFEKKRIFGYGPQGDRVLIDQSNYYGNNVSNTLIYALLSGGYFSLIILILIYIYTAYMILNYFLVNKIFFNKFSIKKENIFVVASIVYTVFFMIRSLFENSFGVFSIDFLIVILSLFIIENNRKTNL
tara:strand:- start:72 stop:1451 length:1380 start_codon:yes stop_codon:yes gene_type:complete